VSRNASEGRIRAALAAALLGCSAGGCTGEPADDDSSPIDDDGWPDDDSATDDDSTPDDDTTADDDATPDDDTEPDDDTLPEGNYLAVNGQVLRMGDLAPVTSADGAEVEAFDPAPLFSGETLLNLGTSAVDDTGLYSFDALDITANPWALVFRVDDPGDVWAPTGTFLPSHLWDGIVDTIEDWPLLVLPAGYDPAIDAALAGAGWAGPPLVEAQAILFSIQDGAGTPLDGAVVSPADGGVVYYSDADLLGGDPAQGFLTGGSPNTATSAAAGGLVVVMTAPFGPYEPFLDGYAFVPQIASGLPDMICMVAVRSLL